MVTSRISCSCPRQRTSKPKSACRHETVHWELQRGVFIWKTWDYYCLRNCFRHILCTPSSFAPNRICRFKSWWYHSVRTSNEGFERVVMFLDCSKFPSSAFDVSNKEAWALPTEYRIPTTLSPNSCLVTLPPMLQL